MDEQRTISVMVVDQHQEVCEALARGLKGLPGFHVLSHTGNLVLAAELAHQFRPDVIIADFKWSETPRPDALRWLARVSPGTRMVVYTSYFTDGEREAFESAGAEHCLLKGLSLKELADQLRKVASRKAVDSAANPYSPPAA